MATREKYLLQVIERMIYNGGISLLQNVNDIPGFKLTIKNKAQGPRLSVSKRPTGT